MKNTNHKMNFINARDAISLLLKPNSIAFVGASSSPEKMSGQPLRNVLNADFKGKIYPVNPSGLSVEGVPTYTSISKIPEKVDVGFVTVPAMHAPESVRELAKIGTKVVVVAVGGFAELGNEKGKKLQEDLVKVAEETGIRLVGPVSNGIYSTNNHLALGYNAIHTRKLETGSIGLVTHSGAMVAPFLSTIEKSGAGLSRFISCGSEADLTLSDYIDYLVHDNETKVIALILDHIGDGEFFRMVIRKARQKGKPVVTLKIGNSDLGRQATLAHSSHLSGAREAYEAVARTDGIINLPTLESLAITSAILSQNRRPHTHSVVACSTSGGGAILLADQLTDKNIPVKKLEIETLEKISNNLLYDSATIMNPFDLGLGGRHNYEDNVEHLAADSGAGVLLGYNTPMATASKRAQLANSFISAAENHPTTPVLVLFPGGLAEDERELYERAKIPIIPSTLETCAITEALLTTANSIDKPADASPKPLSKKTSILVNRIEKGAFSEHESKQILKEFGVNLPKEHFIETLAEAKNAAEDINFPVVLKACGRQIAHKTENKLLEIGINSQEELDNAWHALQDRINDQVEGFLITEMIEGKVEVEVIFGIVHDSEFGLIAILGPGGVFSELFGSNSMSRAPLPLSEEVIHEMINRTVLKELLSGFRGGVPCDVDALVEQIINICSAAESLSNRLDALDVNPIMVKEKGNGAWPLDALIVLRK